MIKQFYLDNFNNFIIQANFNTNEFLAEEIELLEGQHFSEIKMEIPAKALLKSIRVACQTKGMITSICPRGIGKITLSNMETEETIMLISLNPIVVNSIDGPVYLIGEFTFRNEKRHILMSDYIPLELVDVLSEFSKQE